MSPGRTRSDNPFDGDPLADPSLEQSISALRALAGSEFDVLGPLGRDAQAQGEYAFLARDVSRNRLVVLKRQRSSPLEAADPGTLQVISQLDSSVPPPAGSCPVCQAPFSNWEPLCPECGANVAGNLSAAPGTSPEKALAAIRQAAEGYEVFGTMCRAVGGAVVYFARELKGGHLVALRLEDDSASGGPGYTITATRMMRPKLLYGTVGGEPFREPGVPPSGPGMWTPVPSPSLVMPLAGIFGGSSLQPSLAGGKLCPQCNQTFGSELRLCPRDGSALRPMAAADGLIGRIIADRYHIVDRLGQGGMGTVYLAEHVRMGRRCAVKVMNPTLLNDPDSLDRFTREAKNASQLNHPHVAAIYDFGETSDGIVYLAMEFVEGESLAAVLDRVHGIPEQQALELASQVADGLSAAHEMGIVHRDLKPDNIMVCHSKSGKLRVKVVDFGIAKATQGGRQTVTRAGYVVGTPAYMSPEQILGDPLDGRSDLYSLGCILYEMLTGQRAFAGPSGEVSMRRRLTEPPPRPRMVKETLSKSLDEVVTKAMARSPEQRFQSAGDLRNALLDTLNARPRKARWRGWLPQARPEPSLQSEETPLVARRPEVTPRGPLISPAPFAMAAPLDSPPEVSPVDLTQPGSPTMRLRHRSARSEGSYTGWLVGSAAAVTLLGVATVFLLSGGELAGTWSKVRGWLPRLAATRTNAMPSTNSDLIVIPEDSTSSPLDSAPPKRDGSGSSATASVDHPVVPATAVIRLRKPLPEGTRITVDTNEVRPTAEGLLRVQPGSHVIRIRAPGYRSARRTIPVADGDTANLDLVLLPLPVSPAETIDTITGAIVFKGDLPAGSVIRVDGRVAPPESHLLTVGAGSHWVAISVPGYATDSSLVMVEQGSWADWSAPELTQLTRLPSHDDASDSPSPVPPTAQGTPPVTDSVAEAPPQ